MIGKEEMLINQKEKDLERGLRELRSKKDSLEGTLDESIKSRDSRFHSPIALVSYDAIKKQHEERLEKCCISISELESLLSVTKQKKQESIEEKIAFNKAEFSTSSKAEETNINWELLLVPNTNFQYNESDYYTIQEIISHWPLSQEDVIKQAMIANEILSVCSIS